VSPIYFGDCAASVETTADEISFDSDGTVALTGKATVIYGKKLFKADRIVVKQQKGERKPSRITAFGNVSFKDGETMVTSNSCEGNMKVVVFSGDVEIVNGDFGNIYADKATYGVETKKLNVTAKKQVRVVLNKDKFTLINRETKR
jgi:lipopolysaccharide export system protein LptA